MDFTIDKGTWCEIVPGKPKEGRVLLRPLNLEMLDKIQKETVTKRTELHHNKNTGSPEMVEFYETDKEKSEEMQYDAAILDWQDITMDGKPLKPTVKNKVMLIRRFPEFSKFYVANMKTLSKAFIKRYGADDEMGN